MPHFFISYAKADTQQLAFTLCDIFNSIPNMSAWVDRNLKAGRSWESDIQIEIRKCDYFVVLYSPDLNRHLDNPGIDESYVLEEIRYARKTLKKQIIPIMAQSTEPPMGMTGIQYINFAAGGMSHEQLAHKILQELGLTVQINHPTKPSSQSILPPPFEWIEIPVGKVLLKPIEIEKQASYLKSDTKFDVSNFQIAKYPITNTQYRKFMESGGYTNKRWWTKEGWYEKQRGWMVYDDREWYVTNNPWLEPLWWNEENYNLDDHPVIGISWYEALAYCNWLSELTGEFITLPTEQQWQRAAQGDNMYDFPWGNTWDPDCCNNNVSQEESCPTTPVWIHEGKGDSPFGVIDMAGNVFEWCLTSFNTGSIRLDGSQMRVLKGGSRTNSIVTSFRCDFRYRRAPYYRNPNLGFRIVRLK